MDVFTDLFHEVETFGPAILGVLPIYLLWNKKNLFFYYIIGFLISALVNLVLKGLLQMPRPSEDTGRFNLLLGCFNTLSAFVFRNKLAHIISRSTAGRYVC